MAYYTALVSSQTITTVPNFTLESGITLTNLPVAYKTWGKLNEKRDNVMVICHAFTGSADVEDWWGPMLGTGGIKAFDPDVWWIFCANVMGSPYGSASPVTSKDGVPSGPAWGPEFPRTSIRDDVRLHYQILTSHLGVSSIGVVIGGSMGGMAALEWPLCTARGFVRNVIPIATSARHSAWGISWGHAQRASIMADPDWEDGYYFLKDSGEEQPRQPASGLAAARMSALLTYRSRDSFESRFGRRVRPAAGILPTPPDSPKTDSRMSQSLKGSSPLSPSSQPSSPSQIPPPLFQAQSYLLYQSTKFIKRFDANCYIHLADKMDTHDLGRGRGGRWSERYRNGTNSDIEEDEEDAPLTDILPLLPPALILGIASDGLFTPNEQSELWEGMNGGIANGNLKATLEMIPSPDGHDGFLLEFKIINRLVMGWLKGRMPEVYEEALVRQGTESQTEQGTALETSDAFKVTKTSVFGEAEDDMDVMQW